MPSRKVLISAFVLSGLVSAARGQVVIGPPSGSAAALGPTTSSASYTQGPAPKAPLSSIASALAKPDALWQFGALAVRPHASYSLVHGTGILRSPGSDETTTLQTFSPGLLLEAGNRAAADYTVTRKWYSTKKLSDSTDHSGWIRGGWIYDEWKLALTGNYGTDTSVLSETGGQTKDETYATSADIAYQLGRRSELELKLGHSDRSANAVTRTPTWQGSHWVLWTADARLRYHVSADLSFAAGFGAGYDEVKSSPDMKHTRQMIEVLWKPTKRISFSGEVGVERRRTLSNPARTENNGFFSATASYSPFEATRVTASAGRSVSPSYFSGLTTQTDTWSAGFEQRLLTKLFLSANVSQSKNNYDSSTGRATPNRDDRYAAYSVRLSTTILRKGTVSVYYQQSRNRSSQALYQYDSDQVGASVTYRF